jgi:hypothetical protein
MCCSGAALLLERVWMRERFGRRLRVVGRAGLVVTDVPQRPVLYRVVQ